MSRISSALIVTLGLTVAAPASAQSFLDSLKGAVVGEDKQERDATYLDQLNQEGTTRDSCGGDGGKSWLNASVEQGLGVVSSKELTSYLEGIVGKLLANAPYPNCEVTVYVTPHDAAQAVALADGGILIALGFLRNLKNEDEVAALLAHELTHILKDHHSSDSFVESQDGFLKGLETANASGGMLLGLVDPGLQKAADAAVSVGDAMYNISESMIAPAWTVNQEDEADLMGTDLLVAAGYNPRAMASVMDIIKAQEANAAAVEAERDKLYKQRLQGTLLDVATSTNVNDTASVVGAVASMTSALVSGTDKKTHRPAAERKSNVSAYIKKFHRKHRRRAFESKAWDGQLNAGISGQMFTRYRKAAAARRAVFTDGDLTAAVKDVNASVAGAFASHSYPRLAQSEVRLKKGDRQAAINSLEAAMKRRDAPWQIYRSYADLQLGLGNKGKAAETVERADEKFNRPLGIAPFAIKVHRAANNEEKVAAYLERCQSSGSRAHVQICRKAAGLESEAASSGSGSGGVGGFLGGLLGAGSKGSSSGSGLSLPFGGSDTEKDPDESDSND